MSRQEQVLRRMLPNLLSELQGQFSRYAYKALLRIFPLFVLLMYGISPNSLRANTSGGSPSAVRALAILNMIHSAQVHSFTCFREHHGDHHLTEEASLQCMQSGVNEVEQFLSKQGLNAQSLISGGKDVTSKAEEAINYASPTVKSTANTIQATSPQILAQYAFALVGVYYLVSLTSDLLPFAVCNSSI